MTFLFLILNVVFAIYCLNRLVTVDYEREGRMWYFIDGLCFALNLAGALSVIF